MCIDNEAELGFELHGGELKFSLRKIEGSFFEALWINNYLNELCLLA